VKTYLLTEMAETSHEILSGATHNTDTVVCLLAPAFYQMDFQRSAWRA